MFLFESDSKTRTPERTLTEAPLVGSSTLALMSQTVFQVELEIPVSWRLLGAAELASLTCTHSGLATATM